MSYVYQGRKNTVGIPTYCLKMKELLHMLQFDLSRTRVIDTLSKVESFDALIFVNVIRFRVYSETEYDIL